MNSDCHYYGTYYVALLAGFSPEQAQKIAWAAETVDECSISNLKPIRSQIPDDKFILTITGPTDNLRDAWHGYLKSSLDEEVNDALRLTALRAIWMPFHFLPGNFEPALDKFQIKRFQGELKNYYQMFNWGNPKWSSQDEHDMALMCRTSTNTCREIIQHAKKQYDTFKESDTNRALFSVGLMLHVLADTWSHEYFCGSPNYYVNYIRSIDKKLADIEDNKNYLVARGSAAGSSSCHNIDSLGHGTGGHFPDYPFLDFKFSHEWMPKTGGKTAERRNNPLRFLNGFSQMLQALLYILGDPLFPEVTLHEMTAFQSVCERCGSSAQSNPSRIYAFDGNPKTFWSMLYTIKDQIFSVHKHETITTTSFFGSRKKKKTVYFNYQDQQWIDFLADTKKEYHKGLVCPPLTDYNLLQFKISGLLTFMDAARAHRRCVLSYLKNCEMYGGEPRFLNTLQHICTQTQLDAINPTAFPDIREETLDQAIRNWFNTFKRFE